MKTGMRSLIVIAGLSLLYVACLVLIAKPLPHLDSPLPPMPFSHNILNFLYLRGLQHLLGFETTTVLIANGGLMLASCWLVFRAGSSLADPRYSVLGGAAAMLLFQLSPLVLVLPVTLGFLGGHLWVPFLLLVFICTLLATENWSAFMRAIVLALAWSLFLWVHLPAALLVLTAMVPWMIYARRPMTAVGIFLTIVFLGAGLFSALWALGCVLARKWSLVQGPIDSLRALFAHVHQGLITAGTGGPGSLDERLIHIAGWLSPFLLVLGLWLTVKSLRTMLMERRAGTGHLAVLLALLVLLGVIFTPGKDVLPGAWSLLLILALWCPLLAQDLAKTENFFSRGFRLTFSAGFLACLVPMAFFQQAASQAGPVPPSAGTLAKVVGAVMVAGLVSRAVLKKHPVATENRGQALLAGATLAYFLVMDVRLFR